MSHAVNHNVGAAYAPPHHISPTWAWIVYLLGRLRPSGWVFEVGAATAMACVIIGQAVHWMLVGLALIDPSRVPQ